MNNVVVIGAGQAGQALVTKLRDLSFDGQITLIGEEPVPPYQRPPLSKKYLLGEMDRERLFLRPESFYGDHDISLRLGQSVESIDRTAKTIKVGSDVVPYGQLALTTGSVPRSLPSAIGGDLGGVFVVRSLRDIDSMQPAMVKGAKALIIGGGYIGLEAAAVAAGLGLSVTVVEMADRILQRVAAPETSDVIRAAHVDHGVVLREGVGLSHLIGETHVRGAILTDGTELACDFVIVGVGITPNTKLAQDAGLVIDNGIRTNAFGQTSDPDIWSAGDCASFPYRWTRIRLESVGNAIDQAELVAANMVGEPQAYLAKPWFWSDQYDLKLQIAGLNTGYDHVVTRPGEVAGSVSIWYYQGQTLLAVDAINDPRAYMVGKRLIEAGKSPAPDVVADAKTALKDLLKG